MNTSSKLRRSVIALVATAAAGLILTACGTSAASTDTVTTPTASPATVTATVTATPAPAVPATPAPAPVSTPAPAPAAPAALPVINPVCLSGSELYLGAAEKLVSAQTMWMIIPSQESVTAHNTAATTFNTTREQLAVVIQSDPLCTDRLTGDFNAVQASLAVLQAQGADVAMPDRTAAVSTFRTAVADYRADVAVLSA